MVASVYTYVYMHDSHKCTLILFNRGYILCAYYIKV